MLPMAAFASHISETMTLANGWNAIYLESTPTNALCEDFFAGSPVERVASYHSDAYSSTRQIADDGTDIAQKPLSYYVWVPGDEASSTMTALVGGHVYGVATTLSLTNPQWATQPVMKSETGAEHEQVMPSADEEDVGLATIYVVPAEGATSQFFKLEAK